MGNLNFHDIQGNILRGYNFAGGLHYFVKVRDEHSGRALLRDLLPEVTRAVEWTERPVIAVNIALTYSGLEALGVQRTILDSLPSAFREPIRARAPRQLGDDLGDWERKLGTSDTHVLVLLASSEKPRGQPEAPLPARFPQLACASVWLTQRLRAHGADCVYRQDVATLPDQREHFGFADGLGQPAVEGMTNNLPGQGTPDADPAAWRDIKAGEFILGYPDEDGEYAEAASGPAAWLLYDGTYMVYRKLEQDVPRFRELLSRQAEAYARAELNACRLTSPLSSRASFELMAAKLVGRWRDGRALELEPGPDRDKDGDLRTRTSGHIDNNFRYGDDRDGHICPVGAHVRRTNPRDLGPSGHGARRHRIIRRGMPYGPPYRDWDGEGERTKRPDHDERGLIFTCFNADLERQFEVVQGQWSNDGNDFGLGAEQDFLLGGRRTGKMTIEGDPPFFVDRNERMVITRGCQYLLMPGLAALERLSAPPAPVSGLEAIPPQEPAATHGIVDLVLAEMHRNYAHTRPMRRGQHPKAHAVLEADFIVQDVPRDLRFGLFAAERSYRAWIRLSSSHTVPQSDAKPDAQGMAIKVLKVEGEKILPDERGQSTQDFILVNHANFFLRDAVAVADFARAVTPTVSQRDAQLRAFAWFARRGDLRGALTLQRTLATKPPNPLAADYWSQTPYALGDDLAVKYSVRAKGPEIGALRSPPADWDALEEAVQRALAPLDAEYWLEFRIQRQANLLAMPVEDPTVLWNEDISPFRTAAMIRIAHQDFTSQERREFGENLSFTPWHSLWAHRPLGGINRVRREVYQASRHLRHERNGAPVREPGGASASCLPRMMDWIRGCLESTAAQPPVGQAEAEQPAG
ncbi:MAG: Dyp-type peroxidase [Solirubrobacterales bacterium]|nr:Dyp-type peroxidase [Solirubrobacterales bacterium]